jgi:hypothetical protein
VCMITLSFTRIDADPLPRPLNQGIIHMHRGRGRGAAERFGFSPCLEEAANADQRG